MSVVLPLRFIHMRSLNGFWTYWGWGLNMLQSHEVRKPHDSVVWEVHLNFNDQGPVVQTLDSAIHWINHNPVDKYLGNQ